jgi:RNA polymerase sigma-70 factor (sigma-E family)
VVTHKPTGARRVGIRGRARLADLYETHGPHALRLAYVLTGDREVAEDLLQDAFVRLSGRFVDLRDPKAFHSYLVKTIVNLANMHFRRKRVERAYVASRQSHASYGTMPDVEGYEEVKTALMKINPRQRAAIVLRFYEDLTEAQTAEVLGCATGTVKSLVHRGLQTLRTEIQR